MRTPFGLGVLGLFGVSGRTLYRLDHWYLNIYG